MRILMSAFSCGPNTGSEPGIGWNWAIEAARLGHEVHVITQTEYQREIEAEIKTGSLPPTLSFEFFMPSWLAALRDAGCNAGLESMTWPIVSPLWQIALVQYLGQRRLADTFDVIHHITLGGVRHPTLLGTLPLPLVLGPLGGGERAPMALRKSFPWRGWLKDLVRDVHTASLRLDPITRSACSRALVVYARTPESRDCLPCVTPDEVGLRLELGIREVAGMPMTPKVPGTLRLMYAGQHVYWKGGHLALRALAKSRQAGLRVHLTMVGSGPEAESWKRLARDQAIEDAITWRGQIPYDAMKAAYEENDAFLYPSLHDSSGNVVLEALSRGLPVICLDLGGPGAIVTPASGRVIPTRHQTEEECVAGLAAAIHQLANEPDLLQRLSAGALSRAQQFLWPVVVAGLYADVERRLAASSSRSCDTARPSLNLAR